MPEQPDWIEISTSQYDCGECKHSLLDRVVVYPGTDNEVRWLACSYCGFEDRDAAKPTVENDWYQERYSG